jgi:hypothetical protein
VRTRWSGLIPLLAALALLTGNASPQSPLMPKMSLGGEKKRDLTPEEKERQPLFVAGPFHLDAGDERGSHV